MKVRLEKTDWSKNQDKFYRIEVVEGIGAYSVIATYGRKGHIGRSIVKLNTCNQNKAINKANELIYQKLAKGYKEIRLVR